MRIIMKRKAMELMIGKYGKELERCKDTEDLVRLMVKVAEREGLQLNHLYEQNQS